MATTSGCKRASTFNDKDISEMDSSSAEKFEDVALIVEGKRIKANSGILAFSSPVFASLLRSSAGGQEGRVMETERHINMLFPSHRYEFRSESSRAVQTTIGEPLMELVIPNYKYKDIKKTLSYLMDKNGKRTMSGEYIFFGSLSSNYAGNTAFYFSYKYLFQLIIDFVATEHNC